MSRPPFVCVPRPRTVRARGSALLVSLLLAPLLAAQSAPSVVGLTAASPLVITQDTGSCALSQCPPAGMPPPSGGFGFEGGTAYDPDTRGVWVSNGLLIGKYDTRNACAPLCPVLPMPNTSPNNPVTGLAYYVPTSTLYVTDRSNVIRWYSVGGGCQLSLVSRCLAPIPAGDVLTGCATDNWTGQIFYSAVTPGNPGGRIYVAQIGAPCLPFCTFPVTSCGTNPMGPLTGVGYDSCAEVIWVTDGKFVKGISFDPIACVVLGEVQCCLNTVDPYIGLAVLSSTEASAGVNCTAPPCPVCTTLAHVLGGDPYVGNPAFGLNLQSAPGGSTAFLILNVGACGPPVFSPPFCAGIRVPLAPPPITASVPTGGTPGLCNGSASITIAIPPNPTLCGLPLCSQYLGVCPGSGLFTSNALQWVIGGI